jgi:hypothetical protein
VYVLRIHLRNAGWSSKCTPNSAVDRNKAQPKIGFGIARRVICSKSAANFAHKLKSLVGPVGGWRGGLAGPPNRRRSAIRISSPTGVYFRGCTAWSNHPQVDGRPVERSNLPYDENMATLPMTYRDESRPDFLSVVIVRHRGTSFCHRACMER